MAERKRSENAATRSVPGPSKILQPVAVCPRRKQSGADAETTGESLARRQRKQSGADAETTGESPARQHYYSTSHILASCRA
jgi:hypothetical protein